MALDKFKLENLPRKVQLVIVAILAIGNAAGRIIAAGMTKEVTFDPMDGPINDPIDHAYRAKYAGSAYLKSMISARARSATIRVMPRGSRFLSQ